MGLLNKIGKSLGKIGDTISKAYKSLDKKAGGYLPGGVTPKQVKASTPSSTPSTSKTSSTKTSSSGSSTPSFRFSSPNYDTSTQTYTNSSGNKQSMSLSNALKTGAVLTSSNTKTSAAKQTIPIDSRTGKPYGTVTAYQRPKGGGVLSEGLGLGGISAKLSSQRGILRTEKIRSRTSNIGPLREAELLGLTALSTVVDFGKGIVDFPETAYRIARNPRVLKELPKAVKQSGEEFGELLRFSPGEAFVKIGGEVLLMKGTGAALNKFSKISSSQLAKLNPKYVGKAEIGKTLKIKTGAGKTVNLKVVGKIPTETLKSQVSKAGKRLNAISSQADALLKVIRRSKTLKKPIPGEAEFSATTKKLLRQFDAGTISKKNLAKLDAAIKKEGAKGILERSFFADPTGKIRPSRLGVTKEGKGSLLDYFTEDITFKKAKPQILLFENIKIQSLPNTLKSIGSKLKRGTALTKKEADKLLEYQLKKSGKFKPVGFISGESEITLAPGEILRRVKKVGVTIAEGKRIPIIKAEVFKPTGKVKDLLAKFRKGDLTKAQTKELDKLLKKKTGFNYGLSSAKKIAGKYVDIKKVSAGILSKIFPKKPTIKIKTIPPTYVKPKKTTPRKPTSPTSPKKSTPKRPKRGKGKPTSKAKTKPKQLSKPVSKPKAAKKTSKITSPRSRRKKPTTSRKVPVSRLKKRYYSSRKTSSPRYSKPYSSKRPSPKSPSKSISKSPKSPSKYKPYKSPTSRPVKGKPSKPFKPIKRSSKPKKTTRKQNLGYYIYEKRGKKGFVKLKGLPLTQQQAKDRLAYRLDNKISRTAKLVPVEKVKKFGSLPKQQKGYFTRYKKNLRNYKIVNGKRVKTPLTFIEKKGKGVINTKGEKRQLALNRKAKTRTKVKGYSKPVKKTTRRTTKRTSNKRTTRQTPKRSTPKRSTPKRKPRRRNIDPFRYW